MATVTGFTAARMQQIENESINSGVIVGDDLILVRRDLVEINAGMVKGAPGTNGTNGATGATGATGPAGPTAMVGLPLNLSTSAALMTSSGLIPGLVRNNVPVIANHTYGINIAFTLQWDSLQTAARWDIWCRLNGSDFQRFDVIMPGYGGSTFRPVRGEVFWTPSSTASTDDITVYAEEVTDGANITPSGASTLKRDLWIIDYGIIT